MNLKLMMNKATAEHKALAFDLLVVGGRVEESAALEALRIARTIVKPSPVPKANISDTAQP